MERVIRRRRGDLELCLHLAMSHLRVPVGFVSRQRAVLCLCEVLTYPPAPPVFDELRGMDDLFAVLRACVLQTESSRSARDSESEEEDDDDDDSVDDEEEDNEEEGEEEEEEEEGDGGGGGSVDSVEAASANDSGEVNGPSASSCENSEDESSSGGVAFGKIPAERLLELRDDLLRAVLVYLRMSAFLDLLSVSPGSASLMCGGSVAPITQQQQQQFLSTGLTLGGAVSDMTDPSAEAGAGGGPAMPPSLYMSVTFDDEGSCCAAAESLLHALRVTAIEYDDLHNRGDLDGDTPAATPTSEVRPLSSSLLAWHSQPRGDHSVPALLWCIPVRMPPLSEQPVVLTKSMLGLPQPHTTPSPGTSGGAGGARRSSRYHPVREVLRNGYLHLLLYILATETTSSRGDNDAIIYLLHILELLSLNPTVTEQMGSTVHVVPRLGSPGEEIIMSDVECSINGVGSVLDMLKKKSPLLTAMALHLLRALVTPPHFLLLPPYLPLDEVERIPTGAPAGAQTQTPFSAPQCSPQSSQRECYLWSSMDRHGPPPPTPRPPLPYGRRPSTTTPLTPHIAKTPGGTGADWDLSFVAAEQSHAVGAEQATDRCPSPSSTITTSVRCTSTAMTVERAQKQARIVARRCNGIQKIVSVLESIYGVSLYVYNIRLGLVQVG